MNTTKLFLAPGPVPVPAFVQKALQGPIIHHRGPAFASVMDSLQDGLRYLFQTEGATGIMIGSGTYGVEAGMYSLFRPGEKILVVNNGKFSERWAEYADVLGLEASTLRCTWGEVPSPDQVLEAATNGEGVTGVVLTHCETSTGALLDLEETIALLRTVLPEVCILVDAITTVGAVPFYFDAWRVDAAVVASHKALMNPAGIIAWAMSERAVARLRSTRSGDFANWYNYWEQGRLKSFPFTPPIQGIYGVQAALEHFRALGLPHIWSEVHRCSRQMKHGIQKIGGTVVGNSPSDSLTAFSWPEAQLHELREKLMEGGYELAGGQGAWQNKILRMSHMGSSAEIAIVDGVLEVLQKATHSGEGAT